MRSAALALALLPALSACALRGPAFTGNARLEYNEAVQKSGREELLLNVVRLRYLEGPEFLSIGSIASQLSFDLGATLGGAFGDEQTLATRVVTPGGTFGYSERPVTTFTPRQDEAFTRRLVEPIALDTLVALTRYGWSLERALFVVVEQANGVRNVATRESLAAADVAAGVRFAALVRALQVLYERRWLELAEVGERSMRRFVLKFAPEARGSAELDGVLAALELPAGREEYELTAAANVAGAIAIRTRSLIGAMAYLSHGVDVPAADFAAARAQAASLEVSVPLKIASSAEEPRSAAVAVRYAGRWFYIETADFESRRTFGALESVVRLQVGAGVASDGPVLTLPIAR